MTVHSKDLTPLQQYQIQQVSATLAIEGMYMSEEDKKELEAIAGGEITVEESIREIIERYKENA